MNQDNPRADESTRDPSVVAERAGQEILRRAGVERIDLALVLGSGWSSGADSLGAPIATCRLEELPGFSAPVVAGHGGELLICRVGAGGEAGQEASGKVAAVFTGRTHYYEGKGAAAVVHGIRAAAAAGAGVVVLTNGCGGLNPEWSAGTPVLIRDHINFTGATPLRGATFIDLTDAYSPRLREIARDVDPSLDEGVYMQFPGPQYETPAEVGMAKAMGADLVGMSTTLETIAAREAGLEVLGISLVTNLAAGISPTPLDHSEVIEAGRAAAPRLAALLQALVGKL